MIAQLAGPASILAANILGLLMIFQFLLVLGLPLGEYAWGGASRVLPPKLRVGSLVAMPVLAAAGWVILARAGHLAPGPEPLLIRVATWVLVGLFALSTLGNLASKSSKERLVMTPAALVIVLCFLTVALS